MNPAARALPSPPAAWASTARNSLGAFVGALVLGDAAFRASGLRLTLQRESWYITRPILLDLDGEPVHVLGLGDSRMGCAFNPSVVERFVAVERGETVRAWNGSLPGAPPMAQLGWVRRWLARPRGARLAVLGISPYMFSSQVGRAPQREALTSIFRIADIPAVLRAGGSVEDAFTVFQSNAFASHQVRPRMIELFLQFRGTRDAASTGVQGFEDHPGADAATQAARARVRVSAYRHELDRAEGARFGSEQQGYFREMLRTLRAHGVRTVVLDTPSASQMDVALGPGSIYPEHRAWLRATTAEYGATYVDARHPPAFDDGDFGDVDHTSTAGSVRFTSWLAHAALVPALGGRRADRPAGCTAVFDWEHNRFESWARRGDAMAAPVVAASRRNQQTVPGFTGTWYFTTFTEAAGDGASGEAVSEPFVLDGATLRVRVGGGRNPGLGVDVRVGDAVIASLHGDDDEQLHDRVVDVRAWRGRRAVVHVRDHVGGAWGHLQWDDLALCPE
jgi:hypothetical protein